MKIKSKEENLRQEFLHQKIKEQTWDKMKSHLEQMSGLVSSLLVTNYHIRVKQKDETKKLELCKTFFGIEIREKYRNADKKKEEVID